MLESFLIVGTQVLVLFILILIGFFCGKSGLLNRQAIGPMNDLVLYIVNPCVIINSFRREFDPAYLKGFLIALLSAAIAHATCLILSLVIFRKQEENKRKVLRFATIFSNCGFMALPLLQALVGSDGVFYGAAYLVVFNLLIWSYGQYTMAKGTDGFSAKKIVLNPSIIAVVIGLVIFFTSAQLPSLIALPVEYLAALNTPLPMIIIGFTISRLDLKSMFRPGDELLVYALRLIAGPVLLLGILYLMGIRGPLLIACIVSSSAPVAGLTTMLSIKFHGDEELSARLVATSTLLSILTMTLIVGFTQFIG